MEEFDKSLYNNIKKINENPIASASIAQIHTAILNNEKKIIIKILKPDVKKIIKRDINILYSISKILTFLFKKIKRLKLIDVIDELKKNLDNETNFKKEISNTIKIKQNTKNINDIYIPNTLESKKEDIFIAEYLDGINITNKEKLIKLKINRSKLIKIILTLFYKQVFEHDIFHADLHPGNILISKTKKNITLILLDFGIIGELKNEEKIYLSENILAFAKQDYKKIIHLHIKANTITLKNNINKMEKEIHDIFKTISKKNSKI
ncbi:MAG TPA: ABC1 kinase family protein [Candidatus Azoamicus sp.]